jgi:O-antigen/teichoic acid export membrane protein
MTVAAMLSMERRVGRPSFGLAKSLLSYARFDAVGRVGGAAYSWVDVVVIGFFLSQAHVGAYELAWKVASVVLVFTDAVATAAFPQLSEYAAKDRFDRIEDTLPRLITPSLMVIIPALFGTLVLSQEILRIVFGPEFVLASVALVVLMANNISSGFYRPVSRTLKALDRPDLNARAVEVNVGLNVVLNVALIPNFGLVGAAVATTTASLVGNLLALTYLTRLIDVRFQWRALAWCVSVSAVMSIAVAAVGSAVAVETALELGLVVAVGVCTYLTLVLVSSSVRSLGREALSALTGHA